MAATPTPTPTPTSTPRRKVFVSVGVPHQEAQEVFIRRIEGSLRSRGLEPMTLGRNNYDYRNPLPAIRNALRDCSGAIVLGLGRRYCEVAIDRYGSPKEEVRTDVYLPTPWNHLEAAMALQLGLPVLILKDQMVLAEGILDQALSDYIVFDFDLAAESIALSKALRLTLAQWINDL